MFRTGGLICVSLGLVALLAPSDAAAQNGERSGFSFGFGLGPSLVPNPDDEGVVFKIVPGFEFFDGVDLEIETGFKRGSSNGVQEGMWPVLLGVRYSLGELPVVPFVTLHFGPGVSASNDDGSWYAESTMFGFSLGGGVDYALGDNYGVGTELSYSFFAPIDDWNPATYHFVDLTVEMRFGF